MSDQVNEAFQKAAANLDVNMGEATGAPDKGVDPLVAAKNPLSLQMQMSAQKKDEERRAGALGMLEQPGGAASESGFKQPRLSATYGSKRTPGKPIQKAPKHERNPLTLNVKTKRPRVIHMTHDPHQRKKFLGQANLAGQA